MLTLDNPNQYDALMQIRVGKGGRTSLGNDKHIDIRHHEPVLEFDRITCSIYFLDVKLHLASDNFYFSDVIFMISLL